MAGTQDAVAPSSAPACASYQYSLQHKQWIVLRRLKLQPMFDDKLHKNDQLWDDLVQEFFMQFPDQTHGTKASVRDQCTISGTSTS